MLSTRSTLVPVAILVLAACSTESSAPTSIDVPLPLPNSQAPSLNNGNGVVLKVSGAGVADFTSGGGTLAPFQFVAMKKADGSVNGHFRMFRTSMGGGVFGTIDFEGDVTCVTVDPNFPGRARIGGVVTANRSTHPSSLTTNHEVGDDVWFRVQSTKSGADAGDKTTTYGFAPTLVNTSAEYCALAFDGLPQWNPGSIFPLAQGNIQIHD
jgi:hypothetical protein